MIHIKFKNLEKSEMAREAVSERIEPVVSKFPDLNQSKIQVTLEMENSITQAGPDLFKIKLHISGGRYNGVIIEKTSSSLYVALAKLVEHMLESLNRLGDKARVKERKKARQIARRLDQSLGLGKPSVEFVI